MQPEATSAAGRTEDFTGADLGALLADAQLAAVHAILNAPGSGVSPVVSTLPAWYTS